MSGAPVKDQRFQKVHNDPRFARNSKRRSKLQIDERFAGVFRDARFQSGQGKYDKYGRRVEKQTNELKKFYRLEDKDEEKGSDSDSDDEDGEQEDDAADKREPKQPQQLQKGSTTSSTSDDEEQDATVAKNDEKLSRLEYLNRMARGELADGNSSDSDSDSDSDDDAEDALESEPESEKEDVPLGEETKRFAVQNCDWSRIRAVDIFALCQSFAPATGAVRDVTIYPSDYGLQKMKEEEQFGPQGLWSAKKPKKTKSSDAPDSGDDSAAEKEDEVSDEEEAEEDDEYDSDDPLGVKKRVDASEDNGFDSEKLRKYELQKLKYYYAIVTCDSVKTASAIFDSCDALEYETSANLLDLRYVPDEIAFVNPPKEACTSVPDTYKPSIFATTALQNTDVKLTWEEDDDNRLELLTRQAEWQNADDNDFSAYLASDNSSDDEDAAGDASESDDDDDVDAASGGEKQASGATADKKKAAKLKKLKSRYRKMLLGSDAEDDESGDEGSGGDGESDGDASDAQAGDGDMEMTFTPGAGDILKAKKQRELEEQETPFERYAREKKQQKNQKLHEKRARQKQREREQKDVLQKKGRGASQAKLLREAIADTGGDDGSDGDDRNFDLKTIAKSEKVQRLKGKRKAKEMRKLGKKAGLQEGFAFDAADPRFGALYATGSQFQLDPTDPKFRKSDANAAIFSERRKRTEKAGGGARAEVADVAAPTGAESKSELRAMVENLKRKSQHKPKKPTASKKQRT